MRGGPFITRLLSGSGLALGSHAQGWAFSLFLHATAVSTAVFTVNGIPVLPQQEPFRWDVSLVEPSGPEPALETHARPAEPVPPAPVEASPAPQPVQPEPVVQKIEPVRETVETVTAATYTAPEPAIEKVETVVQPPAEPAPAQPTQVAALPPAASSVSEPSSAPAPPDSSSASAVGTGPVRADYGWLAEMLYRRVSELKRYPASARLNGWEGRVVVRAVIQMDGHLTNLTVAESSGYEALDQAAMDAVRLACPLKLEHKLFGRSTVVVQVPISYMLRN